MVFLWYNIRHDNEDWIRRHAIFFTKKKPETEYFVFAGCVVLFLVFYGIKCLDVTNTDWLMTGGDLSQHYLGWKFFRFSKWHFQIGMMDTIAYPFLESVLFTDSIPLFALPFKLLSGILPDSFQYFGWWGLFCFVMQGELACAILKKYIKTPVSLIAGSLLFVLTPSMLRRMYWHTSLGGQWILLLSIWALIWQKEHFTAVRKSVLFWGMMGFLSVLIHIYFVPMCGIFLLGFLIRDYLFYKKPIRLLTAGAAYGTAVIGMTWLLGGFGSGMSSGAPGLAYYSFNLNGFFNTLEWNCILPRLSTYTAGQFEGFAYLGAGILILVIFTTLLLIYSIASGSILFDKKNWQRLGVVLAMAVPCVFMAASNELTFGTHLLLKIPVSNRIGSIWSIFRSTGRLIWPCVYLIMLYAIISTKSMRNRRLWSAILVLAFVIQLIDLTPAVRGQAEQVRQPETYETLLQDDLWSRLSGYEHLVMTDKDNLSQEQLYALADFASDRSMTINDFYFARALASPVSRVADDFAKHPDENTIFIFSGKSYFQCASYPLHYYCANGMVIGLKNEITGFPGIEPAEYTSYHMEFNGENLLNGEDKDKIRYLYDGGVSYGPFLALEPGTYTVKITGFGIDSADVSCYSEGGANIIETKNETELASKRVLIVSIDERVEDFEINIKNTGKELYLTDLSISKNK